MLYGARWLLADGIGGEELGGEGVFRRVGIYSPDIHSVTSGKAIVTIFSSEQLSLHERLLFLLVSFWQL